MSQRNNDNTKRQKPKENQLGIFKTSTHFAGKFNKGPGFQERELLGLHICLWEYTQKVATSFSQESPQLYLVVQGRVQLEHSSHIGNTRLDANTSSPGVYLRKRLKQRANLELCHRNPDILAMVLNWIVLSNSTVGSLHSCKL